MKSKSATLTKQLQYQRWAEEVKACESRPVGMSVARWCRENGIKQPTYYDHLHKVKELCIDIYANNSFEESSSTPVVASTTDISVVPAPSFVELPLPAEKTVASRQITIHLGKAEIEVSEDISDDFLRRLLGVVSHA
ncbi:MAG: hypothetical protein IJJ59_02575 [Pseudobutyrivibrio sp.]|uniref:hypothetical protein n=1 Tax=Pseudobutyrivibrio sp. TaxID=2014367 RepID=UPI0025F893FD|nr:hypothetical protein [Pseudobutyrivibrio sp.]MBQ6462193.1 hypothetical protein [Pseudobutyrivibrio sp.]